MRECKGFFDEKLPPVSLVEYGFIKTLTHLQRANNRDQSTLFSTIDVISTSRREVVPLINVIIPVSGRSDHLRLSLASLNASIASLPATARSSISITVAEMDTSSNHKQIATQNADFYMFIKSHQGIFNKSLLMNKAATAFSTEFFLFYDVDLIIEPVFFLFLIDYIAKICKADSSSASAIPEVSWISQPIHQRKIFYVNEDLTNKLFSGDIKQSDLNNHVHAETGDVFVQPTWFQGNYPPGGAVLVPRELFEAVGGYDPELFWDYSPEDRFFLQNCVSLCNGQLYTPSHEIGKMYHLYHPDSEKTNNGYEHMVAIDQILATSPPARCMYTLNKHILKTCFTQDDPGQIVKFLSTQENWNPDGTPTSFGLQSLEKLRKPSRKLIDMVLQWWRLDTSSIGAQDNGMASIHLRLFPDILDPNDTRLSKMVTALSSYL